MEPEPELEASGAPTAGMEDRSAAQFQPQDEVMTVHGLRSARAAHLNGQRGVVTWFNADKGRYEVELTGDPKALLKAENLRLVSTKPAGAEVPVAAPAPEPAPAPAPASAPAAVLAPAAPSPASVWAASRGSPQGTPSRAPRQPCARSWWRPQLAVLRLRNARSRPRSKPS
eukprot:COSAG01_NODE_16927_length_1193_cov_1.092322_1_plen_171_part_00